MCHEVAISMIITLLFLPYSKYCQCLQRFFIKLYHFDTSKFQRKVTLRRIKKEGGGVCQLYCFNESVSVTFLYYTFGVTGVYDLFLFQADENYIFNYLIKNPNSISIF